MVNVSAFLSRLSISGILIRQSKLSTSGLCLEGDDDRLLLVSRNLDDHIVNVVMVLVHQTHGVE